MNTVHFRSTTAEWATPLPLFNALDREFHFTLDPCATATNAKCRTYFTRTENGLRQDWATHTVFMNPPYGREIAAWVAKAYQAAHRGALIVGLLPARTDTTWWHDYCMRANEIRLLRGRVQFVPHNGNPASAPFPSAIVIWRPGAFTITPALTVLDLKTLDRTNMHHLHPLHTQPTPHQNKDANP